MLTTRKMFLLVLSSLSLFLARVQAQGGTLDLGNLPQCAQSCVAQGIAIAPCGSTSDRPCLCDESGRFLNYTLQCNFDNCNQTDVYLGNAGLESYCEPTTSDGGIPWGSYTEVINDTPGKMCIRYAPDTGGIIALGVILTALVDIILIAVTGGVTAPVLLMTLTGLKVLLATWPDDATITDAMVDEAAQSAINKGLFCVPSGGSYKSEKLTLSLVHQANVALFLPANPNTTIDTYSGSFTVWTGATLNSVKHYSLNSKLGDLTYKVLTIQLTNDTTTSTSATTSASSTPTPPSGGTVPAWGQCGGIGWTGGTACIGPYVCQVANPYFSQCVPA